MTSTTHHSHSNDQHYTPQSQQNVQHNTPQSQQWPLLHTSHSNDQHNKPQSQQWPAQHTTVMVMTSTTHHSNGNDQHNTPQSQQWPALHTTLSKSFLSCQLFCISLHLSFHHLCSSLIWLVIGHCHNILHASFCDRWPQRSNAYSWKPCGRCVCCVGETLCKCLSLFLPHVLSSTCKHCRHSSLCIAKASFTFVFVVYSGLENRLSA